MKKGRNKSALSAQTLKMYSREIARFQKSYEELYGRKPHVGDGEFLRDYFLRCRNRYRNSPSGLILHLAAVRHWMAARSVAAISLRGIVTGMEVGPQRILTPAEVDLLIGKVEASLCRLMLRFIYASGARHQETLRIRVGDIDSMGRAITLRDRKDRCYRETMLPPELLIPIFRETNYKKPDDYLFSMRRNREGLHLPVSNRTLPLALNRAADETGLQDVSVQMLRDSFAVHMIRKGIDPRLIMRLMGYRSPYSFRRYRSYMREPRTVFPSLLGSIASEG